MVSAGIQHSWDKKMLEFMGISGADTTQLADGTVLVGEVAGHLTLVEVTPLGIRFEGSVAIESWDVPTRKLSAMKIDKITMKDGRESEITELDSWGASRGSGGYKFRGYYGVGVLKEPLDPGEVESITTDGKEIKL